MAALRIAVVATLVFVSLGHAQIQIDDRPKVLETKPLHQGRTQGARKPSCFSVMPDRFTASPSFRQRHDKLIEATSTLEKAASLDPDSLEIRRALISLYMKIGRDDDATKLCREVLDRDPHDVETAHQFAKLLKEQGKPAEAIRRLAKGGRVQVRRRTAGAVALHALRLVRVAAGQTGFCCREQSPGSRSFARSRRSASNFSTATASPARI